MISRVAEEEMRRSASWRGCSTTGTDSVAGSDVPAGAGGGVGGSAERSAIGEEVIHGKALGLENAIEALEAEGAASAEVI